MKQPLKILSVIDIPWNSGLAAYAFDQALALRGGGHSVTFAAPPGSAAAGFAAREGFESLPIPGRKEYWRLPLCALRLRAAARERKIDIVCAHTGQAQTLGFLLGLPLLRVKADLKPPSAGLIASAVRKTVAASAYIGGLCAGAGLGAGAVTVVRQGIKLPPPSARPLPAVLKIGLLGRLDPVKGHACFLRAAAALLKAGEAAEFHIAGYEANLKYADLLRLAEELEIPGKVVFHGKVENPFGFMAACDIGVIASLGSEAVSRAALEWLACGRPLVSTPAGSLPEFTGPELLTPPGDHLALAARLSELIKDPARLQRLGKENRARAASEFSPEAFAAATCAAFEQVVSPVPGSAAPASRPPAPVS